MTRLGTLGVLLGGCVCAAVAIVSAGAQTYPTQTIRIIVPLAPGGLIDTVARLVQPRLEKALGRTVIVENRPGASGIVGTDVVAKAAPDGHTLLMVASSHPVVPATNPKVPYDIARDFAAIVRVTQNPFFFVVNSKVPAGTLQEFVALAKKSPGKYNYGTPGAAGQNHLVTALFSHRAGISLQHVPYRGGGPAMVSLIAGEIEFAVLSPVVALPHIQSGAIRALATGGRERDTQFPQVPTVAESGYPGFEAVQWVGLLATGGTPKPVIDRLNAEVNRALADPTFAERFVKVGTSAAGGSSEDFETQILREYHDWVEVARAAGIKAE
jgi:tripartite-type tricarboxylate transporter receptor subunit TctC